VSSHALHIFVLWLIYELSMHGTGHGVGEYLGVHEGPQGIGPSLSFQGASDIPHAPSSNLTIQWYIATPFVPGHVMSNEPAYYEVGHFGIRIESVLVVKDVSTRRSFGDKTWLGFERFTVVRPSLLPRALCAHECGLGPHSNEDDRYISHVKGSERLARNSQQAMSTETSSLPQGRQASSQVPQIAIDL
jgi:hypothetical protein